MEPLGSCVIVPYDARSGFLNLDKRPDATGWVCENWYGIQMACRLKTRECTSLFDAE